MAVKGLQNARTHDFKMRGFTLSSSMDLVMSKHFLHAGKILIEKIIKYDSQHISVESGNESVVIVLAFMDAFTASS